MRTFKHRNKEHDEKMSVGWVYSGYCCPYCANPRKWSKRGVNNSKKKTLRTFRKGMNKSQFVKTQWIGKGLQTTSTNPKMNFDNGNHFLI